MILECPNCGKRYLVDPRAVGANGRTVRCAACKKEWFASAEKDEVDEVLSFADEVDRQTEDSDWEQPAARPDRSRGTPGVPAIAGAPPVPASLKAATTALGILFLIMAAVYFQPTVSRAMPFAKSIYASLGMYDTQGVVLADLAYNLEPVGTKDRHALSGYLVNTADEPMPMPILSFRMLDREGELVKRLKLSEVVDELQPGEQKMFSRYIDTSPERVERIAVDVGSPWEVKLRSNETEKLNLEEGTNNE